MNAAAAMSDRRLGEILVERGIVGSDQVERAAELARREGVPLGQALLDGVRVNEVDLYAALAEQAGWPLADADAFDLDASVPQVQQFSISYLTRHRILPLLHRASGQIVLATADPFVSPDVLHDVQRMLRRNEIDVFVLTPTDYARVWYDLTASLQDQQSGATEAPQDADVDIDGSRLFEQILLDAVAARATDIHLESGSEGLIARFRIDGILRSGGGPWSPHVASALVNVIKVRGAMDISEHRRPQAGAMQHTIGERGFDIRIQTMPTILGENVVLRLLPNDPRRFLIEELGFPRPIAHLWREVSRAPSGLALIVGPTGSGKTTTIYSALAEIAEPGDRKILTLEDPVEYRAEGIQQTSIRPKVGLDWSEGIRVMLRQDPDVLLIGEVRDYDTARAAVRASQTGHLTLATLHANDGPDAVQRLLDLDLPLRSLLGELLLVLAQRLVPRNCPACRRPATLEEVEPQVRRWLKRVWDPEQDGPFRHMVGQGCSLCEGRGIHGRI
ncbi:MAG: hypothetical protein D6761_09435, partial [Candidatus Dadabacteria bacterium]